jgi:hypothetical protein
MRPAGGVGRYELKYVLPAERRPEVLEIVSPHVQPDPHARPMSDGAVGYHVHSLYLDTPDLDDYFERLERRKVRNRLRVRTYGQPGERQPVFLENKRKYGRWVVKHRVQVCDSVVWTGSDDPRPWTALAEQVDGMGRFAAQSFCQLVDGGCRLPVSVVHYEREVLVPRRDDGQHVRLTLDRRVRATVAPPVTGLFEPSDVDLIPVEWMVMELKFDSRLPGWMRQLCRYLGVRAVPVTKFGLSVAKGLRAGRDHELRLLTPRPLVENGYAA